MIITDTCISRCFLFKILNKILIYSKIFSFKNKQYRNIYYFSRTLNQNYMKNLKKLSREAAKQINGGIGLFRCSITRPCSVGYCCNGECIDHDCMIEP